MASPQIVGSTDSLEEACITLANRLIVQCDLPVSEVCSVKDINSNLITLLFETICDNTIPDLVSFSDSIDEAHNVQAVIDTISLDVLGISLSHISGEDVIHGDVNAISNLLEVFEGILLYVRPEVPFKRVSSNHGEDAGFQVLSQPSTIQPASSAQHSSRETSHEPLSTIIFKSVTKTQDSKKTSTLTRTEEVAGPSQRKEQKSEDNLGQVLAKVVTDKTDDQKDGNTVVQSQRRPLVRKRKALKRLSPQDEIPSSQPRPLERKRKALKPLTTPQDEIPSNQGIVDQYEKNLENRIKTYLEQQTSYKNGASQLKKTFLKTSKKPLRKQFSPLCKKSFLLPTNLRRRRSVSTSPKRLHTGISSSRPVFSGKKREEKPSKPEQAVFLKNLLEEFPGVTLSPHAVRNMTKKYEKHLTTMHKRVKTSLLQKPRTQIQLEEASKRQEILSNIIKNEMQRSNLLKRTQQEKMSLHKIDWSLRDARLRSAKTKHYYEDYYEQMHKKMQSRNLAAELLVQNTHKETLKLEKEQVRILCNRAKESRENDAANSRNYLESLENFYESQFSMLAESLAVEKRDMQERAKAQKKVLRKICRDKRKRLEHEVEDFQQQVVEAQRDIHFRELDADQYLENQRDRFSAAP